MADPTQDAQLRIAAAPHIHSGASTRDIMWSVVYTLVPILLAAIWIHGIAAVLVVLSASAGALVTEHFLGKHNSLDDGSAIITGLLLGMTLPASFPMWMAFVGGFYAIAAGKLLFGGLGQNVFNPALLGRAFLQASFPVWITTWPKIGRGLLTIYRSNFAFPFMKPHGADIITAATPLGLSKFEHTATPITHLFVGNVGGCIGETSALLILAGGGYLVYKKYMQWRTPLAIFLSVSALSFIVHAVNPVFPGPLFMLGSGGLMFGAVYMATDLVTSPITKAGAWVFGIGIGGLVVLIRYWGGLPEGVMYAILLMNALVPTINRVTRPRRFGHVAIEAL